MDKIKRIWRWLVALKDGLALIALLLFFLILFMLLSSSGDPLDRRKGALLVNLNGVVVEQAEEGDPLALLQGGLPSFAQYRSRDVIRALRLAAKDDDIKAVVLNLDGFMGGGQIVVQDIGQALDEVRAAKKKVLTYATGYADDGYALASHADEVWLNPLGAVVLAGPGGTNPYYKGLLDRFGVNVHVYRVGKFKSFVEPYLLERQSPEAKAANQQLADALWEDWQTHVKKARPQADFAAILNDPASFVGEAGLAEAALRLKLVDKLGDETLFGKRVGELVGREKGESPGDFDRSTLEAYLSENPESGWGDGVGIVTIAGGIVDGTAGSGTAGGDSIAALIHDAIKRDDVKALVLRIDSPGGSVTASEKIRLALDQARNRNMPIIASMGNVAASGGYWAAMGADKVYAEPGTVTGSIGVFGVFPTFERTLQRYGVNADGVKTTPLSGQPDIIAGTTAETDRLFQAGVDDVYRRFTKLVAAQRKLPLPRVEELAQGRVWDGGSARQLGLVDAFGGLDEAVAEAAKRAKLDPDDVRRIDMEPQPGFLSWLVGGFLGQAQATAPSDWISQLVRRREAQLGTAFADATQILAGPAVQLRCMGCPATLRPTAQAEIRQSIFSRMFK
jgi:protease IV